MKRALLVLTGVVGGLLGSFAALAQTAHMTEEICIKAADAGRVCTASDGGVDYYQSACEIQNNGSTPLWCAFQNPGDAVPQHSRQIAASGGTWALDVHGATAIWCTPGLGIDQQPYNNDGGLTADGGPAGCTVFTVAH